MSEKDGLVNPQCSIEIAQHWNACCYFNELAGHDIPADDPLWFILNFKLADKVFSEYLSAG